MPESKTTIKSSILFTVESYRETQELCKRAGCENISELIKRALDVFDFINERVKDGNKIYFGKDGSGSEICFPYWDTAIAEAEKVRRGYE